MFEGLGHTQQALLTALLYRATDMSIDEMKEVGYESQVFFRSGGPAQIIAHNCVFHQLAEAHPEVCELDLALIGSLGGGDMQHLECMLRGGQVCRFQLAGKAS